MQMVRDSRVDERVGDVEHLDRGHDVEVHDSLGEAGEVPEGSNPQKGRSKNSEKLQEDRPPTASKTHTELIPLRINIRVSTHHMRLKYWVQVATPMTLLLGSAM
jgi:hypothetical protein